MARVLVIAGLILVVLLFILPTAPIDEPVQEEQKNGVVLDDGVPF